MTSLTTESPYFDPATPRVAIVGRPNTGKSTLFNRLIGKRKSITDPTPGVTRDPVRSLWTLRGKPVVLLDTGGLSESKEFLDKMITERSLKTASEAQLVVLVLDVQDGVSPDDQDFIDRLRKLGGRIILCINKVDNTEREKEVWNYFSLGFNKVFGVSATHNLGVWELAEAIADELGLAEEPVEVAADDADDADDVDHEEGEGEEDAAPQPNTADEPWDLRVAILGQPNTGKSTLLNLLTASELSLVSPIAGTTRDVIEGSFIYKNKVFRILDTAGIRRKAKVHEDLEYYSVNRAIAAIDEADVVFLMMDAEKGLVDQDKKISDQIIKKGKAVVFVLNKWDLMENLPNQFAAVCDRVRYLFPVLSFAPILAISAKEAKGIRELLEKAIVLRQALTTRIDTGKLNRMLSDWVEYTPPPTTKGASRWKLRYITQTSANPLEFVLFVNKKRGFPEAYLSYICNKMRAECGLDEVPFTVHLRERTGKKGD